MGEGQERNCEVWDRMGEGRKRDGRGAGEGQERNKTRTGKGQRGIGKDKGRK
jgi:hypothetical protein